MMEDPHGEKYALLSLTKPKRVHQVHDCIAEWNLHQLGDAKAIQLTPHPGNDDIITFGKTSDTMANHYVYKTITDEQHKSECGESHTYREWSSDEPKPASRILKGLENNLADGYVRPSEPKRTPKKAAPTHNPQTHKRSLPAAGYDTDDDDEGVALAGPVPPASPAAAPQAPVAAPQPPAASLPVAAASTQVAVYSVDAVTHLSMSALKSKDEVTDAVKRERDQYKDTMERERLLLTETKDDLRAARRDLDRTRTLKESAEAQLWELKERYMTETGRVFKPSPKRRCA